MSISTTYPGDTPVKGGEYKLKLILFTHHTEERGPYSRKKNKKHMNIGCKVKGF